MDRVEIAREERRRQMAEELEFERDRAGELRNEINRLALELEGPGIDEEVLAKMAPEDAELIRESLQSGPLAERAAGADEDWLGDMPEEDGADDEQLEAELRAEQEAEIVRLEEEIVASERRQQALQAYLDALG